MTTKEKARKKLLDRAEAVREDLSAALQTVDIGYPFYGVPRAIRRAILLIDALTGDL